MAAMLTSSDDVTSPYSMAPDFTTFMLESSKFINHHQWVWDIQMTKFFQFQYWKRITTEWREPLLKLTTEELNQLPFGFIQSDWPESLQQYVRTSQRLYIEHTLCEWVSTHHKILSSRKRMTAKKIHEVSYMAGLVDDICHRTRCSVVLDIGSGLGYLGQVLREECGLMVVGIEREKSRVITARRRADTTNTTPDTSNTTPNTTPDTADTTPDTADTANTTPDTSNTTHDTVNTVPDTANTVPDTANTVPDTADTANTTPDTANTVPDTTYDNISSLTSVQLNITDTEQTRKKLNSLIQHIKCHLGSDVKICIVGLHCCGDLTPVILRLFTSQIHLDICSMVLVGCCYHKMTCHDGRFINFPMSAYLTNHSQTINNINIYAMRLAAQETRARWRRQTNVEHNQHERNVSYRAMLEVVLSDSGQRVDVRAKKYTSFERYANDVSKLLMNPELEWNLIQYYTSHHEYMSYVEPFTALQVCMQGSIEGLILADRITFLKEHGFISATLIPIFDDLISPRNIAIVTTLPGNSL